MPLVDRRACVASKTSISSVLFGTVCSHSSVFCSGCQSSVRDNTNNFWVCNLRSLKHCHAQHREVNMLSRSISRMAGQASKVSNRSGMKLHLPAFVAPEQGAEVINALLVCSCVAPDELCARAPSGQCNYERKLHHYFPPGAVLDRSRCGFMKPCLTECSLEEFRGPLSPHFQLHSCLCRPPPCSGWVLLL